MDTFSYSRRYKAGQKVRYQGYNYVSLRETNGHTPGVSDYHWKRVSDDDDYSTAGVRPRKPDDDGDDLLTAAVGIGSSILDSDAVSSVFEAAGGLFGGGGAGGVD